MSWLASKKVKKDKQMRLHYVFYLKSCNLSIGSNNLRRGAHLSFGGVVIQEEELWPILVFKPNQSSCEENHMLS